MSTLKPLNGIPEDVWKTMTQKERNKVRRKNWYLKNRDRVLKKGREYNKQPEVQERAYKRSRRPDRIRYNRERLKRPEVILKTKDSAKKYRARLDARPNSKGPRYTGTKSIKQFCFGLLENMKTHLKRLEINIDIEYTIDHLIKMANTHDRFVVDELRSFELRYTNGFFNSASIQRWDETKGYTFENTTPIPIMLQSPFAFTMQQLRDIPFMIQRPTPNAIIDEWREQFKPRCRSIFGERASSMRKSKKQFIFDSTNHAVNFLRAKFIEQGGCCFFSGLPMRLIPNTRAFVMSVERLNPVHGYTPDNIVLICAGFNSPIYGQHITCRKTENGSEAHQRAVDLAKFNLPYWRQSMKYTDDDLAEIEETRTRNRELMKTWPGLEIKPRTKRAPQVKRARVEVVDDDNDFTQFR